MTKAIDRSAPWQVQWLFWLLVSVAVADAWKVFLENLAQTESSGDASKVNSYGYLGLYQMGELALIDAGYYRSDGTSANDWQGQWTGKNGINSVQDFLANTAAQNQAITAYDTVLWNQIESKGLIQYLGNTYNGTIITPSGLLAAGHLLGAGGLSSCLHGSGSCTDGYGTTATNYLAQFANYDVSSITGTQAANAGTNVPSQNDSGNGQDMAVINGSVQPGEAAPVSPGAAFQAGSGYAPTFVKATALAVLGMWLFTWSGWISMFQFKGWRDGRLTGMDMQVNVVRSVVVIMVVLGLVML
jgi:integrating conjugative element protein (TIGR03758 family)